MSDVDDVQSQQADLQSKFVQLDQMVRSFIEADKRAKAVQLAEVRILRVREELSSQFGHYDGVRRSTTGLLQAFDSGLVTPEAVQSVTEEYLINAPRYWLAPVLVALAAWSRDEPELARIAIDEALKRDPDKTGLLFTLVLRRFGRYEAAAQWLDQYLLRQDAGGLGREFVVILEAVANGGFGVSAKHVVSEYMGEWLDRFERDESFTRKQIDRWRDEYRLLAAPIVGDPYPTLKRVCSNWVKLEASLQGVRGNGRIRDHFDGVFTGELFVPPTIQHQIDDLLTTLVSEFDVEELPLRTQEAKYQSIIDNDGDEDRAAIDFKTTQDALAKTVDFATLLTNAAMRPTEAGVSKGTQRMAVALTKGWATRAFDEHTNTIRDAVPTEIVLEIEDWTGTLHGPTDVDALAADVEGFMERKTQAEIDKIKFGGKHLVAAIGGGVVLLLGLFTLNVVLIVMALAAGVYAFFGYRGLDARRDATRKAGDARKAQAIETVRNCSTELVDFRIEWQREDDVAEEVRTFLDSINPAEHTMTRPDEARAIR